jgi:ATP-dependent Clp protease adapter protein ClpS
MNEHDIPFGYNEYEQNNDAAPDVGQKIKVNNKHEPLKQYVVLLHDSPIHTDFYVIEMLSKICAMTVEQAKEAAAKFLPGAEVVSVFTGHLEICELKAEQIASYGGDPYALEMNLVSDTSMSASVVPICD